MKQFKCIVVLAVLGLAACQEDMPHWGPCPDTMTGMAGGQCSTFEVPLDWDKSGDSSPNEKIQVVARRYRAHPSSTMTMGKTVKSRQLWLVDGGPGGNGESLADAGLLAPFLERGWDIYIPTHRGTGVSTPLGCEPQQAEDSPGGAFVTDAELPGCANDLSANWGNKLAHFTAGQAARDLGHMIGLSQPLVGEEPVSVYGISYGSYLVQRYLQYFPNQAQSIVVDSLLDLQADVWMQDVYANEIGLQLFERCAADSTCAQKLNGDPLHALETAFQTIVEKRCEPLSGLDVATLRRMMLLTLHVSFESRLLAPAIIHRINRCDAKSAFELLRLAAIVDDIGAQLETGENQMLFYNVLFHDFWRPEKSAQELAQLDQGLFFSSNRQPIYARLYDIWPVTGNTAASGDIDTDIPVLMLQGGLDPATVPRWARQTAARFQGAHQHIAWFPDAGHATLVQTPTVNFESCAMKMMLGFMENPQQAPGAPCQSALSTLDFSGNSESVRQLAAAIFGSGLWE